jgi:phage tail-like protein
MPPDPYYPPGAFYFTVSILTAGGGPRTPSRDSAFQEVSGIQAEFETETVFEGGENRFAWKLPRYAKYPNLVLKRGLVTRGSALSTWVLSSIQSGLALPVSTRDLTVKLLNMQSQPLITWTIVRAYPLRWQLGDLNSTSNTVLVESLELSYCFFTRVES